MLPIPVGSLFEILGKKMHLFSEGRGNAGMLYQISIQRCRAASMSADDNEIWEKSKPGCKCPGYLHDPLQGRRPCSRIYEWLHVEHQNVRSRPSNLLNSATSGINSFCRVLRNAGLIDGIRMCVEFRRLSHPLYPPRVVCRSIRALKSSPAPGGGRRRMSRRSLLLTFLL